MLSLPARLGGLIRSPRRTFADVVERPRWIDALALTTVVVFLCSAALLRTDVGKLALVDQLERTALAFGQTVGDTEYARLQQLSENGLGYAAITSLLTGPVLTFVIAAVLAPVLKSVGTRATFPQLLAIVAHAGLLFALRALVATPLNYAYETLASPTTLARLVSSYDESAPVARFLGSVDLFVIWWVVLLAVGVSALNHRPARRLAVAFAGAYLVVALLLAMAMALAGGTA